MDRGKERLVRIQGRGSSPLPSSPQPTPPIRLLHLYRWVCKTWKFSKLCLNTSPFLKRAAGANSCFSKMILDVYSKRSFSRSRLLRNVAIYEAFVIPGQALCILLINFTISWKSPWKKSFIKGLPTFNMMSLEKLHFPSLKLYFTVNNSCISDAVQHYCGGQSSRTPGPPPAASVELRDLRLFLGHTLMYVPNATEVSQ